MSDRPTTGPASSPSGPGPAAGLGMQLAVGMLFFVGGGYWLDRKRGGGVAFTLAGVALGLFYMGYEVWKLVRAMNRAAEQSEKRNHDAS